MQRIKKEMKELNLPNIIEKYHGKKRSLKTEKYKKKITE